MNAIADFSKFFLGLRYPYQIAYLA